MLDGMNGAEDFYFEVLRQVRMDRWSDGRVVLTGDTAWCATPLSGIGTTLAIMEAYVLAGELPRTDGCGAAFAEYDHVTRRLVRKGQGLPKIVPRPLNPHSRIDLAQMRVIGAPGVRGFTVKLFSRNASAVELPQYGAIPADRASPDGDHHPTLDGRPLGRSPPGRRDGHVECCPDSGFTGHVVLLSAPRRPAFR